MAERTEEAELDCVQGGVGLRELPLATIVVRGPDRLTWLNGLATCDFSKAKEGDAVYGLFVAKNGKIQSELHALLGPDDVLLGVRREKAAELASALDRYLVMEDAELELVEDGPRWFAVLGARAADAVGPSRELAGRAGLSSRNGLPVAIVAAQRASASDVVDRVRAAVTPSCTLSDSGWNRVRVEHGIAEAGVDFDDSNYPQEAALEADAVSFEKGCYLGQEAVYMLEKRGHVKKRLVQLVVDGDVDVGDKIASTDGAEAGAVTSRIQRVGQNLALGYVKYKFARAETELKVLHAGAPQPARVTSLLALRADDE